MRRLNAPSTARKTARATIGVGNLQRRSPRRSAILQLKVTSETAAITAGDGQLIFCIDSDMAGLSLVAVNAFVTTVSSSGALSIQVRNVTTTPDMLTTPISIDVSELSSFTAATPPVIDTSNRQVSLGDLIAIDIDAAGTGAKGLGVMLTFQ